MEQGIEEKNLKDRVLSYYENKSFHALRSLFKDYEVADLAEVFADVELETNIALFRLVPRVRKAQVFSYLPFERQENLIKELPHVVVASMLNQMVADDRTKLLEELPESIQKILLNFLNPAERENALKLLSYPEDSVGRLMDMEYVSLAANMSVRQALETIRWRSISSPEHLNKIFVTDDDEAVIGEVDLATIVTTDPVTTRLSELMAQTSVYLSPYDSGTDAVDAFRKYDRQLIPVVDESKVMIGVVTADDVFDYAEEEATEDIHQFGGQGALEDSYFQTPFLVMLRKRGGWLAFLFFGTMFTGNILRHYQELLNKMGYLVIFLPLIVSAGGNAGTQAASLILRGIALNEMHPKDWFRILRREVFTGLSLGLIVGSMGYFRAGTWNYSQHVGVVVALSLVFVVIFGAVVGSMLP
ncbi:MAG: magnesium transporter, partial [Bdellovibrionota bacterium]